MAEEGAAASRPRGGRIALVALAMILPGCVGKPVASDDSALTIESDSMEPNLRDGDRVVIAPVNVRDDVATTAEGGAPRFGMPGDIVAYFPRNDRNRSPIIHRTVAWVDVAVEPNGSRSYTIAWNESVECPELAVAVENGAACRFGEGGIVSAPLGIFAAYRPAESGFVTKGDNPATNSRADQGSGISEIVQIPWLSGKVIRVVSAER